MIRFILKIHLKPIIFKGSYDEYVRLFLLPNSLHSTNSKQMVLEGTN